MSIRTLSSPVCAIIISLVAIYLFCGYEVIMHGVIYDDDVYVYMYVVIYAVIMRNFMASVEPF